MKKIFNERSNSHLLPLTSHFSRGISLIALIITIIVIIILAAIVIFTGLNTPDRANLAKFVQEISDLRLAVQQDFMHKKAEYAISGQTRSDAQIYNIIAKGEDIDMNSPTEPAGYVADLGLNLEGTEYYELTDDRNVQNWNSNKGYAEPRYSAGSSVGTERHYITDKGEVFILPGYLTEDDGNSKFYVSEKVSYNSNDGTPKRDTGSIPLSETYHIGDIVLYHPDETSYTTNSMSNGGKTGTTAVTLYTSGDTVWKILSINESAKTVDITAYNGTNTDEKVTFQTIRGYLYGIQELHNICAALYSNSGLGVTARSLTLKELNEACGYVPQYTQVYVYHVSQEECDASGDPETIDGITYTHAYTASNSFFIGNGETMEGGEETVAAVGTKSYPCRKPLPGNPVYVTENKIEYSPNESGVGRVPAVGDVLGDNNCFLASPSVRTGMYAVYFGIYYANSSSVNPYSWITTSAGGTGPSSHGLRPVITLSTSLFDGTGDGTTGWNLK